MKHTKATPAWRRFLTNRRTIQSAALLISNASVLSFLRFIPCGYLQCSNCALSTFSCPLILIQRGAVMASMGMMSSLDSKFAASALAALAILVFFGAAFGSWGCGWLCPFGFLQDLLDKVPVRKFKLPLWSGFLRLPIFIALVIAIPYLSRHMFFCDLCPTGAINNLWQRALGIPLFFKTPEGIWAIMSLTFLVGILLTALFTHRPFCSLFCPIGGFYGIFNKFSGLFISVKNEYCLQCERCGDSCPQGIDPSRDQSHSQCNRCLECVSTKCKFIDIDVRI